VTWACVVVVGLIIVRRLGALNISRGWFMDLSPSDVSALWTTLTAATSIFAPPARSRDTTPKIATEGKMIEHHLYAPHS
jgi:hypothetical protein